MKFITKFNKGDKVWFMSDNRPTEVEISAIKIMYVDNRSNHIKYNAKDVVCPRSWLDYTDVFEESLFKTKEELLKSL